MTDKRKDVSCPAWVWHVLSYTAICCATQRILYFLWPCPSHRALGRTLCCENIALGTSPQCLKQTCWCQGKWSDFILCHLTEGQVGSWRALWGLWEGGGRGGATLGKGGSWIRLTKRTFWHHNSWAVCMLEIERYNLSNNYYIVTLNCALLACSSWMLL